MMKRSHRLQRLRRPNEKIQICVPLVFLSYDEVIWLSTRTGFNWLIQPSTDPSKLPRWDGLPQGNHNNPSFEIRKTFALTQCSKFSDSSMFWIRNARTARSRRAVDDHCTAWKVFVDTSENEPLQDFLQDIRPPPLKKIHDNSVNRRSQGRWKKSQTSYQPG